MLINPSHQSPSRALAWTRSGISIAAVILAFLSTELPSSAAWQQESSTGSLDSGCTSIASSLCLQAHADIGDIDQSQLFATLILSDPQLPPIVKESLPALLNVFRDRKRQSAWYYFKNSSFLWVDASALHRIESCAAACNMPFTCL